MNINAKIRAMDSKLFEMAGENFLKEREWKKATFRVGTALTSEELKTREEKEKNCYNELMGSLIEFSSFSTKRDNYAQAVCKYSEFDSLFIVDIIATLISAYQGEEYVVRHANYHLKAQAGGDKNVIHPLIIVNKEFDAQDYFEGENDLSELENKGKVVVLRKQEYVWMLNSISFYKEVEHVSLKSIPYAQNFVDEIIEYRINNQLDVIDEETLINLLLAFIEANFDQIVEYRKKMTLNQNVISKQEINAQIIKKLKNKTGN